jgi:hypothetical protein
MSNALAIATVTATLQQIVTDVIPSSGVAGALATTLRPDDSSGLPNPGVNIFLFQVSPNTAARNADLPTRRADGTLLRRPQAALDLHYLFTFYGDDVINDQQRLLGVVVRKFHAEPALPRETIRRVQTNVAELNFSDLAEQIDLVRLTPVNFSLEEMSKLWSVFLKTDYVLSLAYTASVVLIETEDPQPGSALPVQEPHLTVLPLSPAVIERVEPQPLELSAAPPTQLILLGRNFDPTDEVIFTTPDRTGPLPGGIQPGGTNNRLTVNLPVGLRAGVNLVRLGNFPPAQTNIQSYSSPTAFILQPRLISIKPGNPISVVVAPPVGATQKVLLILNLLSSPKAYVLPANAHGPEATTLTFNVPGGAVIPSGPYLARIRVGDAESQLQPPKGKFNGPTVAIP